MSEITDSAAKLALRQRDVYVCMMGRKYKRKEKRKRELLLNFSIQINRREYQTKVETQAKSQLLQRTVKTVKNATEENGNQTNVDNKQFLIKTQT